MLVQLLKYQKKNGTNNLDLKKKMTYGWVEKTSDW